MAYQHKINWSDPGKGSDVLSFALVPEPFKSAVLDLHIQIEGQLEDIISLAFRDPTMFKVNRFSPKVDLVRALIGKPPDDEIHENRIGIVLFFALAGAPFLRPACGVSYSGTSLGFSL